MIISHKFIKMHIYFATIFFLFYKYILSNICLRLYHMMFNHKKLNKQIELILEIYIYSMKNKYHYNN